MGQTAATAHDKAGSLTPAPVDRRQCPTCGRCDQDWTAPGSKALLLLDGTKARQRSSTEDRTVRYRDWRRTLGRALYVNDVDQLEWRMVDEQVQPVGVLELTRVDGSVPVPPSYLARILDRVQRRDPQGRVACELASRCGVFAFLVAWRWNCSEFWVYNLSAARGWWHLTPEKYRTWIAGLTGRRA